MAGANILFGTDVADRVRFDPRDQRAPALTKILAELRERKMPAYVELDAATGFVTRVRLPKIVRVHEITETPNGDVFLSFHHSHALHTVRRGDPEAEAMLRTLREAGNERWLAVTADDAGTILDVRPWQPPPEPPSGEPGPGARWWQWRGWPWNWYPWAWWPWAWSPLCTSRARAQQLFDLCAGRTCDPNSVEAPCIPFNFPDDGCQGRAHEMARILIEAGAYPRKLWMYAVMRPRTPNHPQCEVLWTFHVAPILCVRRSFFTHEDLVLDPALFDGPVTPDEWRRRVNAPEARLVPTTWDIWERVNSSIEYDAGFYFTNTMLAGYRTALQLRSLEYGTPPYPACS